MSYRDLDGEPLEDVPPVPPPPLDSTGPGHEPGSPRRRPSGFAVSVGVLLALIAALGVFRVVQARQPEPAAAAASPLDTSASTAAPPARTPPTSAAGPGTPGTGGASSRPSMGIPGTTNSTPVDPAPTGDAPEPTAASDGGAAALAAAQRFIPAWTSPGTPEARSAALRDVADAPLAAQLANVDPSRLPTVTGSPKVRQSTPALTLVDVGTSAGTAVLTVQPVAAGWRVTAVSLEAATPTGTGAAA